jgi:hypothetical protein
MLRIMDARHGRRVAVNSLRTITTQLFICATRDPYRADHREEDVAVRGRQSPPIRRPGAKRAARQTKKLAPASCGLHGRRVRNHARRLALHGWPLAIGRSGKPKESTRGVSARTLIHRQA